jgi:hypothetical protein
MFFSRGMDEVSHIALQVATPAGKEPKLLNHVKHEFHLNNI